MLGGVGWTLADSWSMKRSVKLMSSIGSSSRSTDCLGGSAASSLILLSNVSGFSLCFAALEADRWEGLAPFCRVLALLERVESGVVEGGSGRGKDRVDRRGLGRCEVLEAIGLLLKLDSIVVRIDSWCKPKLNRDHYK